VPAWTLACHASVPLLVLYGVFYKVILLLIVCLFSKEKKMILN